jgi:transketolase
MMNEEKLVQLQQFAKRVRNHIVPMASDGGCFLGASLSAVDLLIYMWIT